MNNKSQDHGSRRTTSIARDRARHQARDADKAEETCPQFCSIIFLNFVFQQ